MITAPRSPILPALTPRATPDGSPPRERRDTSARFTLDGSTDLEQHLTRTCAKIAAGIRGLIPQRKLEAILLGGGYGRGEGGVLRMPAGDRPYNDLEFYVCLRGNRHWNERRFGKPLHVLGEILTPQAGVEVEFKITSLAEFARRPVSMFSYDLVMGHRWLLGREELLANCAHHRAAEQIPLAEATRLLMNRCSGLLFAKERLERREFTAADADFVRRNLAKAELALGDAWLVAHGRYHWSVRERQQRLAPIVQGESPAWLDAVLRHHVTGTEFKLHPERSTAAREDLLALHRPVSELARHVWLWIEERRLRVAFSSAREYAGSGADKCGGTSAFRNVLVNTKTLGPRAILRGRATHHPRERVLRALTLLLWEPATMETPALLRQVQDELQTDATDFAGIMHAYRHLWAQVN